MYQFWKRMLIMPLSWLWMHPRVTGLENVPADGPLLLAINHRGTWDPILVGLVLDREVSYMAKKELFAPGGSLRHRIVAAVVNGLHQVPIDRGAATLGPALEVLKQGDVLGIFPEGTRSPDGRLYRGKTGVARLALESGAPVLPVDVDARLKGRGLSRVFPRHPLVAFGKPRSYADLSDRQQEHEVVRWVADDVIAAIKELSGQEYVDVYAIAVKKGSITLEEANQHVLADPRQGVNRPSL